MNIQGQYKSALDPQIVSKSIQFALRAWKNSSGTPQNLLENLLVVQNTYIEISANNPLANPREATNQVLLDCIGNLLQQDEESAELLKTRFIKGNTIRKAAFQLHLSTYQINRQQKDAIFNLAHILIEKENQARISRFQQIEESLPPRSYSKLFGMQDHVNKIQSLLLQDQEPYLIFIHGIGGIGKSALADFVARRIAASFNFQEIYWLRFNPHYVHAPNAEKNITIKDLLEQIASKLLPVEAPPEKYPRLIHQALKNAPALLILDNLNFKFDPTELFQRLQALTPPSKFLVTTRTLPPTHSNLYTVHLNEITISDATKLMLHQAESIGLDSLTDEIKKDSSTIYDVVGGNPFALKLVVGLLKTLPLDEILFGLRKNYPGDIATMYQHIYKKIWRTLSSNARTLLKGMLLISEEGGQLSQLQAVSSINDQQIGITVQELVSCSLLEIRGSIHDRRYGIHQLTETFLKSELPQKTSGRSK